MRYFYDYGTQTVKVVSENACPICGTKDCDCEWVVTDAYNKMVRTLAKGFNVPGRTIREYIQEKLW